MQAVRPKQSQKAKNKQAQSQATDARQITQQESIGAIKLLIHAGLGSIAFLRGLFPERVFQDDRIDDVVSLPDSKGNPGRASARVKTLKRGLLPEADTVLDYLDGVYDALGRGYLKTFMMGVYLDPDHPYQLIELYTFNFIYRDIDGKDGQKSKVADMEVRDQLRDRIISTHGQNGVGEEVEEDYTPEMRSKWTIAAAREQAQKLVKALVTMTQVLDTLPRQKYITFKLYYTPDTPDDYEPPGFKSVDSEVAKFMVGTKAADTRPDTNIYGKMDTGHHCMTVRMMTVAKQLPDQDELQASQLEGPPLKEEASQRPVLWPAEDIIVDEECDTSYETLSEQEAKQKNRKPLGLAGSDGSLDPESQIVDHGSKGMITAAPEAPEEAANRMPRTFTYSIGPDMPYDVEMDGGLTDAERLRLAAESHEPYTMETHLLSRGPTLCDGPAQASAQANEASRAQSAPGRQQLSDILGGTQTLPRGTALARDESSIAFSSVFAAKDVGNGEPSDDDNIVEVPEGSVGPQKLPAPSIAPTSQVESPRPPFSQAEEPQVPTISEAAVVEVNDSVLQPRQARASGKSSVTLVMNPTQDPQGQASRPSSSNKVKEIVSPAKGKGKGKFNKADSEGSLTSHEDPDEDDEDEDWLECDCGNNDSGKFEDSAVACDICKTWKHLSCYGDLRKEMGEEETFKCYSCQIKPKGKAPRSAEEEGQREAVLQELVSLTLFRRMLHLQYEQKPYPEPKPLAKRLQCDLSTAKELIDRAKEEEFLTLPILAEDSMQSSSGSGKAKRGRPKKPKASDYMPNRTERALKRKRERYFTPGEGEEKEIKAKFAPNSAQAPPARVATSEAHSQGQKNVVISPERAQGPNVPSSMPISPARNALSNISNSPRATRTAPAVLPPAAMVAAKEKYRAADVGTQEQESYLPTPHTVERPTVGPIAFGSSSRSPAVATSSTGPPGASIGKTSYKPLIPRGRSEASTNALSGSMAVDPTSNPNLASSSILAVAAGGQESSRGETSGNTFNTDNGRKRTAAEAALDEGPDPSKIRQPVFLKPTSRKASIAVSGVRAKDERDEMEAGMYDDEDFDMSDIDESATQYSTGVRN